ncbi:hypothetical protein GPJ56_010066 [Histomonas meleagridis]|uniref:uncharacterized protein n=1 Tax=Histomonas meleagridis TaxID=135588 RepID=UPI00355A5C4D|nr:hypothetical protein GPJ56_010066 [Histomonas meleagridis]KAH0805852.1 hypothetical protein GO595_001342 [Histomonas meleagridis]
MKAKGSHIIFVAIGGVYQIGKTSIIEMLTGDSSIKTRPSEVMRTFTFGPYSYNFIRKRFELEEIEGDDTEVFFIDTEGCNGFSWHKKIEIYRLIVPYVTLSGVFIAVFPAHTSIDVSSEKVLLDLIDSSHKGTNIVPKVIIAVQHVNDYEYPDEMIFNEKQNELTERFSQIFPKKYQFAEVIPLPRINYVDDVLKQSETYNEGFRIFAQHSIKHIEELRKCLTFSKEEALQKFEQLMKNEQIDEYFGD